MEQRNYITLKWGTTKSYSFPDKPEALELIKELDAIDETIIPDEPCIRNRQTDRQKEILCQLIDLSDGDTIYLHWEGNDVPKAEAKEYVMTYGQEDSQPVQDLQTVTDKGNDVVINKNFYIPIYGLIIAFQSMIKTANDPFQNRSDRFALFLFIHTTTIFVGMCILAKLYNHG